MAVSQSRQHMCLHPHSIQLHFCLLGLYKRNSQSSKTPDNWNLPPLEHQVSLNLQSTESPNSFRKMSFFNCHIVSTQYHIPNSQTYSVQVMKLTPLWPFLWFTAFVFFISFPVSARTSTDSDIQDLPADDVPSVKKVNKDQLTEQEYNGNLVPWWCFNFKPRIRYGGQKLQGRAKTQGQKLQSSYHIPNLLIA